MVALFALFRFAKPKNQSAILNWLVEHAGRTDARAEEEFGKLARFCVTDEDAVSEQHAINLVSARFTGHTGYMWVSYYQTAYDKNHAVTSGNGGKSIGSQILSRWELSQDGGKWTVTAIREHP